MSCGWRGNDGSVGKDEQERDEEPEAEAAVLPAREAMSLISQGLGTEESEAGDSAAGRDAPDPRQAALGDVDPTVRADGD